MNKNVIDLLPTAICSCYSMSVTLKVGYVVTKKIDKIAFFATYALTYLYS